MVPNNIAALNDVIRISSVLSFDYVRNVINLAIESPNGTKIWLSTISHKA